jgi:iron complex outermembrane receptor protein
MGLQRSVLLAVFLGSASAAEALDLRLVDRAGTPVAGAEVMVVGLTGSSRSGPDGRVTIKPDPNPPFVLLIVLAGGTVARPVPVAKLDGTLLTVTVEAAVTEEVTVAAGVAPSIEAAPGAAMTMLSAREVGLRGPANLMQALENVPGVNQVSEGQAAVPAVRGLARGRTLILIDGSRVTSERRAGPSATFMDPSIVDGIDIARGPGSVAYGSDALGGVISVRTRRPGYTGLQGTVSGTFGGGIPDRRGEGSISKGFGKGGVLAAVHVRGADDYDGPDQAIVNSGWKDSGFLVRAEHLAAGGVFSTSWQSDFGRDVERPRNNSNAVRFYYPFENSHRFNVSFERAFETLDVLRVSAFFGAMEQRTDQDRIPTASRARDIVRADIESKDYQFRLTGEKVIGKAVVEFGADLNGRYGLEAHDILIQYDLAGEITSSTDFASIASARRNDNGVFAQFETPLGGRASVKAGVRGDRVTTVNAGGFFGDRSVTHAAGAGFAALTASPAPNVTLTAQLSRGFRDPTISDRFFRGPNARGFITGNPDLEPETSLQTDLGARYATGRVRLGAYYYHYRITDLIERFSPATDFFEFRNRGRARIRGFEFETQADLGAGFAAEVAAQIGRGLALDDQAALDDISADSFSIQVRKAVGTQLMAFVRLAVTDKDARPGPSEVEAPGYTSLDLGAGWHAGRRLEVRGAVRNLLNEEYYASPDPRFVFAPGVNGFVTVAVKF